MNAIAIKRNSWHYRIATKMAAYRPEWDYETGADVDDICRYRRHVIGGLFLILLAAVGIAVVGFLLTQFLFGVVFSLLYGAWLFTPAAEAVMLVGGVIVIGVSLFMGLNKAGEMYHEYKYNKKREAKPDGFVKQAYNSWKEKYCVKVTFVNGSEE